MNEPVDADIRQARVQLDALCRKVSLQPVEALPEIKDGVVPPDGATLWSSSYAHLLLWPLMSIEPSAIEQGASEAQGWFDEVLARFESSNPGQPIDGYLVLALPRPPDVDAKEAIRRLELSSQICRKHLIWPAVAAEDEEMTEAWSRVADVTVLGLPDAETAAAAELYWPDIDMEAQAVWDDLVVLGAPATAQKDEAE